MLWSTPPKVAAATPYRTLAPRATLAIATALLSLAFGVARADSNRALTFTEIGNLTHSAIEAQLAQAGADLHRSRLLLVLADLQRRTPQQSRQSLASARALLARQGQPATLGAEQAYADALDCELSHGSQTLTATPASCDALSGHLQGLNDNMVRAIVLRTMALVHHREGRLPQALDINRLALDAARACAVPMVTATVLVQRGITLREYGLPEQALENFDQARATLSGDRPVFNINLDVLIGSTQLEIEQADSALASFLRGLEWAEHSGASLMAVRLRDFTAQAYLHLGEADIAVQYLEGVFAGPVPLLTPDIAISALTTLARAYQAQGASQRAEDTFQRALQLTKEHNDSARRQTTQLAYARALSEQQKPEQALALLEPLIAEMQSAESTLHLVAALDVQSQVNAQLGQFAAAYAAQTRSRVLQRSLQSANFERSLSFQRAELELSRQQDELSLLRAREASLQAQSQLNRTLLVTFTLLGIAAALLIYLWMSRRLQQQAAATSERTSKELETQVIARTHALENELASRLLLEEERRQLEVNMAEGDKLRTIGQLTSGVAHDFNNLMTVVTLSAELLTHSKPPLTERQQQCVNDILLASESGSNVTSGLLAYARQQSLEPESIALHDYIRQSEPLFRRTLGEGIDLQTELQHMTLTVDQSNLTTALINLMANAREATGGRGQVILRTELLAQHPGPESGDQHQHPRQHGNFGDWVRISVSDNGRGMSATERKRAVEPFYTTKSGGKGSGLGLSMVYGFAKQSGGELVIESRASGGIRMVIWLPSGVATSETARVVSVTTQIPISDGATVWLVEDQQALRLTMRRLLESMGLIVEDIDNADKAAERMHTHAPPDLLLSDVIMPGTRTGNELADEMRARYPHLPVLLMSGYTDLVEIDYPILQKPFSLEELRHRVASTLSGQPTAKAS